MRDHEHDELAENFTANAVPESLRAAAAETYEEFLAERRVLMARVIRDYYANYEIGPSRYG